MDTKLVKKIDLLLKHKEYETLKILLSKQNFHTLAQVIDNLHDEKKKIFTLLPSHIQAEVVLILSDESKQKILPYMSIQDISQFLHFNDEDDATDVLQYLPEGKHTNILNMLKDEKRKKIEKLLKFGKDTAGGLMDLDYIIVKDTFTFKDIADKVQQHIEKENKVPFVLLAKEDGKITGYIPHKNLILSSPRTPATKLAHPLQLISHHLDQEKIIEHLLDVKGEAIGVIDNKENILGIIHVKDLLRIAQSEATEDVYKFAGVTKEEDPSDGIMTKVQRRYKWLIINLATAFLAASVVSLFEDTIARLAILAVYMPIVAGEGGNAATQALAVVVRGLAANEIPWSQARKIIMKEAVAGMTNGLIVGIFASVVAYLLHAPVMMGVVLGIAMIVNLFIAGLFGALVPFVLKSLKIDPAVASTVFVTTATDVIGFFVFLGLGSILL
ncbi:MAG TPA: magnesium transporter [Candidatus Nitrosocosmicus sp.]|nr:magnesium transporter [Candidatus Nitrosocosmicus sp.]